VINQWKKGLNTTRIDPPYGNKDPTKPCEEKSPSQLKEVERIGRKTHHFKKEREIWQKHIYTYGEP